MPYSPLTGSTPMGKTRSPWGVWWLSLITVGIYYLVWYVKVNKEIALAAGADVQVSTFGLWFSQCIPIASWISMAHTAERLSTAQHRRGTAPTVSAGMTILSSLWFGSQTRYLQRRANLLWSHMAQQQRLQLATPAYRSAVAARVAAPPVLEQAPVVPPMPVGRFLTRARVRSL